ncbi:enolase C-terminal domain-like protein [Bosea sp. BK604]|uniref:enolase C-terminal domain-like protein n=1 Tax=Bosea sp. BK604 TaxID=2512180 RepID=UPI001052640D|nr:enolase C-terminal domain-like protein [Bosea sp. BK604]TCR66391.1 L-alanine-DL-glutamate epimerase-like enolase superfamily enzyme [Bosea sp. BK604]
MKIVDVKARVFTYKTDTSRDSEGHGHPGPTRDARQALLTITADDGTQGHTTCLPAYVTEDLLQSYIRPILIGRDPLMREQIWHALYKRQRGSSGQMSDRVVCAVELALWDLYGKILKQPVWRLAGGYRDKILAYGSTMCGDELEGGLATPEDYGRFAEWMVKERGYKAIKLHTWMPPIKGAPDVKLDIAACAAVREAVGPEIPLMVDPNHWYSRQDSLWLCQQLEELNYLWIEEMMEEASLSAYQWLNSKLTRLNILGPENMQGKYWTRAEWAAKGACDMIRTGVYDVGGISPSLKCAHIAEGFHMLCEVHGGGAGNMAVCASIQNTTYYERGLLHPFIDHDKPPAYLNRIDDEMDRDGYVHMRDEPGLGQDINHDYIEAHLV